jgi:phenylpropionate dioxygenase-like ring-hydroxylating dioxygenase large terminal subunit
MSEQQPVFDPERFREEGRAVVDWIADYWASLASRPVSSAVSPGHVRSHLPLRPPEAAEPLADVLHDLDRVIAPGLLHWQHPAFFGYFPASASGPSILGELLSAGLGVQGMLWATSPACTELETHVLDWLRDLLGLPLLMTRDRTGEIHVLLNVCRHRGARMVKDENEVCRHSGLSCPYHAWTYDLNGALRGVPKHEAFPLVDKTHNGLRKLPSVVRHGFIWAILDPAQTDIDVARFLGDIDHDLATLGLGEHYFFRQRVQRRATNWKLMLDAFQETYHIKKLHAPTIAPFFTDVNPAGEAVGLHTRILVGRDRLADAENLPAEQWDLRRHATLTHVIFPNSLLIYHPDSTSHMGMFPTGPNEMTFVHTMFIPEDAKTEKQIAHWDRNFAMIDGGVFSAEDLFISEQIQIGVASGANEALVFGRQEHHLRRFHENVRAMIETKD